MAIDTTETIVDRCAPLGRRSDMIAGDSDDWLSSEAAGEHGRLVDSDVGFRGDGLFLTAILHSLGLLKSLLRERRAARRRRLQSRR